MTDHPTTGKIQPTMQHTIDVFGVGNALVDILAMVDDEFLVNQNLDKGGMHLVDADQQSAILKQLGDAPRQLQAGGSAANTMVILAQCGGSGFYAGKVADDEHGQYYQKGLVEAGLTTSVRPAMPSTRTTTGTSLVLTTPDAERTMCTHLGVSTSLSPDDINDKQLKQSKICYIEGYLWDAENPRNACRLTMETASQQGSKISFTFSDPFLVGRYGDDFRKLVKNDCQILFCNAEEARIFCDNPSIEQCAEQLRHDLELLFLTDGKNGCLVATPDAVERVEGFAVDAIDTVGAGDAFAGGVLYGLTNGLTPTQSARWGNYLASRIVTIQGARLDATQIPPLNTIITDLEIPAT